MSARQFVFFYGTLMTAFNRPWRREVEDQLVFKGYGSIAAALFDLGAYPAAVPDCGGRVRGELYEMTRADDVLRTLDEFEGYSPASPESSLYARLITPVTLDDGEELQAWVYFYSAPLDHAERIESGDYLSFFKTR